MSKIKIKPRIKIPATNPRPPAVCYLVYPLTIATIISPSRNPPKFPVAKSSPTAEPSPTGKTS